MAAFVNLVGAFLIGRLINYTQVYGDDYEALLGEIVGAKLRYQESGAFFLVALPFWVANTRRSAANSID